MRMNINELLHCLLQVCTIRINLFAMQKFFLDTTSDSKTTASLNFYLFYDAAQSMKNDHSEKIVLLLTMEPIANYRCIDWH